MDTQTNGLVIKRTKLEALHLDPANARLHDERNLQSITASLKRFGQAEPLIVQGSSGRVIGGNGRLEAMRSMGWTECDVVELDLDEVQATSLGIALNRTADLAAWDNEVLGKLLDSLRNEDSLEAVGFDDFEIDEILSGLLADAEVGEVDDPGPGDLPEAPVTKPGDVWLLGEHRLLCGDSTSPADVERLMAGERAQLLATDPPYLVDYKGAGGAKQDGEHWDDYKGNDPSLEFFTGWLRASLAHCVPDVPVYQWHAHKRQALVQAAWEQAGLLLHQQIIWVKSRGTLGRSHFMWQHEPCFYGWPQGKMPTKTRKPANNATTVWEIGQAGEQDGIHPTQKPTEIFCRPIESHTRPGEVVLEPFSGSGTQIISAEKLGRRCFAMEKEPGYVDVAVRRWEQATGKSATLEAQG